MNNSSTIRLSWSQHGILRLPSIRGANGHSLQPYTDYYDSMLEDYEELEPDVARSSIEPRTYSIHEFAVFLEKQELSLENVTNKVLRAYKKWALARVQKNPRHRGDINSAKTTVNGKLKWIYHLLNWCQSQFLLPSGTIGPVRCKVKSTLPSIDLERNPSDYILAAKQKYPLYYTRTGARGSAPGTGQHWATEDDLEKLEQEFWKSADLVRKRNLLMLRILNIRAWRIGSANSITCSQFSAKALAAQEGRKAFTVVPPKQKNGATRPYELPWPLARSISKYIADDVEGRAAIVNKVKRGKYKETDKIFISTDRGAALPSKEWSGIFGDKFKKLFAQKGAAAHSLRRGAGQRRAEQLIESLAEMGIPITAETITTELMQFLGHSSKEAQAAYLMALRRRYGNSQVDKLAASLENKILENDELKSKLAHLEAQNRALSETVALLRRARSKKAKPAFTAVTA